MAEDLAEFENTTVKDAYEHITQTGEHSNLGRYVDLIGLVYSEKYLIKKIGLKYWLFFWKRKLYLQKQVFYEIHGKAL